jgi:hypothetical protein
LLGSSARHKRKGAALASRGLAYYVDTLNLYSARQRGFYLAQVAPNDRFVVGPSGLTPRAPRIVVFTPRPSSASD